MRLSILAKFSGNQIAFVLVTEILISIQTIVDLTPRH
jgi:hypothetical protein